MFRKCLLLLMIITGINAYAQETYLGLGYSTGQVRLTKLEKIVGQMNSDAGNILQKMPGFSLPYGFTLQSGKYLSSYGFRYAWSSYWETNILEQQSVDGRVIQEKLKMRYNALKLQGSYTLINANAFQFSAGTGLHFGILKLMYKEKNVDSISMLPYQTVHSSGHIGGQVFLNLDIKPVKGAKWMISFQAFHDFHFNSADFMGIWNYVLDAKTEDHQYDSPDFSGVSMSFCYFLD